MTASFFAPFDPSVRSVRSGHSGGTAFRRAAAADAPALAAVEVAVRGSRPESALAAMERALGRGRTPLWLAEAGGTVVAYAKAAWLPTADDGGMSPEGFYLAGCTVLPGHRRRGLGRELTRLRLEWIARRADEAWYFANASNLSSLAMHVEFGFTEIRRGPLFHGVGFSGGEGVLLRARCGRIGG
ncbi:MAG: GNAT family N-acetyltransferase [Actinomycetales bacterium]